MSVVTGYVVLCDQRYFSSKQKKIIWDRDRGICGICWRKVRESEWHADHITPWSLGGMTVIENGQVSHKECNWEKSSSEDFSNINWNRNWRKWVKWFN